MFTRCTSDPNDVSRFVPPVADLQEALERNAVEADTLRRLLRVALDHERRRRERISDREPKEVPHVVS